MTSTAVTYDQFWLACGIGLAAGAYTVVVLNGWLRSQSSTQPWRNSAGDPWWSYRYGRNALGLPVAILFRGSVVTKYTVGVSKRHAVYRLKRWFDKTGGRS